MLNIKNLTFFFEETPILEDLSFSIHEGEIVSLIGISGSGKTTLFRLITQLLQPKSGSIQAEGSVGYMQQEDLLLPWRTSLKNLLLFTELGQGKGDHEVLKERALRLMEAIGLKGYEEAYPHELSGGMRQRLSLARSLLQDHPILLLDEPFGSLDVLIREELYHLLTHIKKTILLITHDFRDALEISNRILVLKHGKIAREFVVSDAMRQDPISREKIITQIRQELSQPLHTVRLEHTL